MTLIIRATGTDVDFSQNALGGNLTSIRTGLVGEYLFGGTLSDSLINWANPDLPLLAVGSPTIGATSAACSPGNGFNTQLKEAGDITVVAVGYSTYAGFATAISNYNGTNAGSSFGLFTNAQTGKIHVQAHLSDNTTTVQNQLDMATPQGEYRTMAGRIGSGTNFLHNNTQYKNGVKTSNNLTTSGTRGTNNTHNIGIGSYVSGSGFPGTITLAAALIYNRVLTDTELDNLYAQVRASLASRSVTT